MQETRQYILDILRVRKQATVDELVGDLEKLRGTSITAVTVRHHLNELLKEQLISTADMKHRASPGRPQHVYVLTDAAREYFPSNYQSLVTHLLTQLKTSFSDSQINVLFEGVADHMVANATVSDGSFIERLTYVVNYLNAHGYNASLKEELDGFILSTINCPYHQIAEGTRTLCEMDMRLVSSMLGVVPRLVSRISDGESACSYFIPYKQLTVE